ncbi:MAG: hypothetical protein IJH99_06110 [Eubacterium sp.]|nr:hypothetical protein [Eubacterium sp.]
MKKGFVKLYSIAVLIAMSAQQVMASRRTGGLSQGWRNPIFGVIFIGVPVAIWIFMIIDSKKRR